MTKEPAPPLQNKIQLLRNWFSGRKGSIVAFSGGIDSTLVLYLARKYQGKEKAIGVISNSESLKKKDFDFAVDFCREYDIKLEIIKTAELSDERYNSNPENRCYFCKEHLYQDLQQVKEKYPEYDVLSGTNHDDLGDYRPGLKAAKEYEILSPMVDCDITKDQLRQIARYFELPNWDKPASPCLSSRIPYNQRITNEKLRQVEAAENILNEFGFSDVRVRHYGDYGKIEVHSDELERLSSLEETVRERILAVGFNDLKIDQEGLVSGKLNRVIKGADNE